jgi:peptidyl-prolyl cis-trans isomerase A (cyclophilin A)
MLLALTMTSASAMAFGPVVAQDSGTVAVTIRTAMGDIDLELYPDRAPITVANFLAYLDAGHYNGGSFYRVVRYDNDNGNPKIEVIQGGANEEGQGAFPAIAHESTEDTGLLHVDGAISMGRGGVGTATSEFFICIGDQPGLDHGQSRNADMQGFSAFGQVVAGMDVVRTIDNIRNTAATEDEYTQGQILEEPVQIVEAVRR